MALKNFSDKDMLPSSAPTPTPAVEANPPKPAPSSPPPKNAVSPPPSNSTQPSKNVAPPPVNSPPPSKQPPPSAPPPSSPPPSSAPPPMQNGNYSNSSTADSPPPRSGSPPPPPSSHAIAPSATNLTHSPPPTGIAGSGGGGGGGGGGAPSSRAPPRGYYYHESSSSSDPVKYVGFTLAAVFIVALVAVAFLAFRKKKSKGIHYVPPYGPPPHLQFLMKPGVDGLYYGTQPGPQSPFGSGRNLVRSASQLGTTLDQAMSSQIAFTYDTVMEMTDSFSSQNVIGEGGFGFVYKGFLPDGKAVAVKQLKAGSLQGEREFRAEVEIISRVHHRHLVSLFGYCISDYNRILIYEFVPNGTLHHHLHASSMPVLDWDKRLKIAIGAAKGLAYLHEDCSQKIIHRDIKSANILLDDAFEAQVADFGLARLTDTANTHVSTRVMGTFGYMAPEYATSGKLTDRSDVYSFGVVLLELVTGKKPVDDTRPLGDESLVEWARPLLLHAIETHECRELIDPRLENNYVQSEMFKMIEAAAACVRHSAPKRPRMVQVVRALDCGDEISDLSNGVKYGQSTVYDSGQYDKDIMIFRKMINGSYVESEPDWYGREFGPESGSQQALMPNSTSVESESKTFNKQRSTKK